MGKTRKERERRQRTFYSFHCRSEMLVQKQTLVLNRTVLGTEFCVIVLRGDNSVSTYNILKIITELISDE